MSLCPFSKAESVQCRTLKPDPEFIKNVESVQVGGDLGEYNFF